MYNTTVSLAQHADLGMPVSGRVRVAALRRLPMTTGVVSAAAEQKCALIGMTDVAVKGAFPGTSAWSPPI